MVLDQSQVSHQQKELEGNKMTEIIIMIINIIPRARVGYEMIVSQRGAKCRVGYNHLIYPTNASGIIVLLKTIKKYCNLWLVSLSKNNQKTILMIPILGHGIIAHIPSMAAKPIKSLELHYAMIHFLIMIIIFPVLDSLFTCNDNVVCQRFSSRLK